MVATSHSILRRLADSRYATRWFVGYGIDVGAADDSLENFMELFPLVTSVLTWDQDQGDAQLFSSVEAETFDFLYSSHCLEHIDDPFLAMGHWVRVVKPGGHLIVSVPDEDLYECGHWPSQFNPDHRTSWTICKAHSWSPASINVVDLLRAVADRALPIKIELIDQGYRYQRKDDPQTGHSMVESAIEFVLKKIDTRDRS